MRAPRIYVDTSVFGGCFDEEFAAESRRFFELVRNGRIIALVSEIVRRELDQAPAQVREILATLPPNRVRRVTIDEDIERLARAYVSGGSCRNELGTMRSTSQPPRMRAPMRSPRGTSGTSSRRCGSAASTP